MQPKVSGEKSSNGESARKRWFYATMSSSGVIQKGDAEALSSFAALLASATISWVDYVTEDANFIEEVTSVATQLGFSRDLVSSFCSDQYLTYQDFDIELGVKLPAIQVKELNVEPYPIWLFLKKNFVLTVHPLSVDRRFARLRRYAEIVLKKIPPGGMPVDKLTMLLSRIIDHNNDRNFDIYAKLKSEATSSMQL